MSDGTLVAVHTTSPYGDRAENGLLSSRYDFHLVRLVSGTPDWVPGARLIPNGISKSITYWDNYSYTQLSYSGPLWELDPVEVRARPRPARHSNPLPAIETTVLREELGDDAAIARLRAFLVARNLALIVSRNVTRRADQQQDFNLKIAGSTTQTIAPGATPIEIAYLQLFQGDLIRGYSQFHQGRRPLAQLLRDGLLPPLDAAPPASVRLAADGSFAALVPAGRALTWQMVQDDGTPVVRERYWVTFAAGEMRVCTNCHGINTTDVVAASAAADQSTRGAAPARELVAGHLRRRRAVADAADPDAATGDGHPHADRDTGRPDRNAGDAGDGQRPRPLLSRRPSAGRRATAGRCGQRLPPAASPSARRSGAT